MFWYLKSFSNQNPKESDWNNSFQDFVSTARVVLENAPSVGIENTRFLLWISFPGATGDTVETIGFGDRGAVCSHAVQSGGRNGSRKGTTGGQRCVCLSDFECLWYGCGFAQVLLLVVLVLLTLLSLLGMCF